MNRELPCDPRFTIHHPRFTLYQGRPGTNPVAPLAGGSYNCRMRPTSLIPVLLLPGLLAAQAPLPRKQIVEEMRIDATREDLPDVAGLRVGPSGQIAIFVYKDTHLRFYDASGKRLGVFGRKGRGPGEFDGYTSFGWVGDTLWLYDPSQLRVTYVSPSLKLLRTETLDHLNRMGRSEDKVPVGAIGSFSPGAIANGRYVGTATMASETPNAPFHSNSRVISIPTRGAGKPTDAGAVMLASEQSWASIVATERYSMSVVPFAFYPGTVFSPDGSRFAVVTTDTAATPRDYTITLVSARGDTVFRRTYPNRGAQIPKAVAESTFAARFGRSSPAMREMGRARMPKSYPALHSFPGGVVLGNDGSVWVQTWDLPGSGSSAIMLDALGKPVLEVKLRPRTTLQAASRTALWVEETDGDGLTSVVRYRVR